MTRIAGVVVLYNPPSDFFENIESYSNQIEILFAIDNSECLNPAIEKKLATLSNVVYRWNGRNLGVAKALNTGARMASERGFRFLLMMDQDSVAPLNLVETYRAFLSTTTLPNVGMLTPFHSYNNYARTSRSEAAKEVEYAITSGTLLNLDTYTQCGPFLDELFIDYVDVEYSMRTRAKGFKILQLGNVVLQHQLGALEGRNILWKRVAVYNHPPERVYYKFRNRLFVARAYRGIHPLWSIMEVAILTNELIKIFLFERRKLTKLKMAILGTRDYFSRRFGKFVDPSAEGRSRAH
ncbi:MAG: glycosyltransferase family 2 protein [Methanothrix sp.]|nr:glycosyltransferase family 2 protein [Methanothrix sp.]